MGTRAYADLTSSYFMVTTTGKDNCTLIFDFISLTEKTMSALLTMSVLFSLETRKFLFSATLCLKFISRRMGRMCCWFESLSHHEIHCMYSRDWGNSSKRIFLKNIDFLVKTFFKDNYLQKNLYEDAASEEIFTLYTREEYNLGRIILKDFFKPV